MTDEQRIELEALITEREGMIADNKAREHGGWCQAYTDSAFFELAEKMRALLNKESSHD